MMDSIRSYLLSVIAAAIICAVVTRLLGKKGTIGTMAKLITGLFLVFTVIHPLADIDLGSFTDFAMDYSIDADRLTADGSNMAKEALAERISGQTRAYILDKAAALNAALSVEVLLSEDEVPVPVAVQIFGEVSPYAKSQLTHMISEDLGIDKEHQTWN